MKILMSAILVSLVVLGIVIFLATADLRIRGEIEN